jgi:uncharacterized protein YoxC
MISPLAERIITIVEYYIVLKDVEPLEKKVSTLSKELEENLLQLELLKQKENELNEEISIMKENYAKFTTEAEKIGILLKEIESKQYQVSSLLNKLSNEQKRCIKQSKDIDKDISI